MYVRWFLFFWYVSVMYAYWLVCVLLSFFVGCDSSNFFQVVLSRVYRAMLICLSVRTRCLLLFP